MTTPLHYAHIYQRPKQGTNFINRYPVYNYQHTIANQGWFDTASFDIAISFANGQRFAEQNIGAFVAIYVDNPMQPIWEGIINRAIFNAGGASYTISIEELANRVSVVFTGAANAAGQTPLVDLTASQAIYGIKQEQVEFGADTSAPATPIRGTLRNTILNQRAYPQASISQAQGQANIVHLELIGVFHTLEWEKVFTTPPAATTTAPTTVIQNIVTGLANGATFFDNTNTSQITTNATAGTVPDQQRGVNQWERIQKIAEAGDATNYWIAGITPTDRNRGTRIAYYRQANFTVEYTAYQKDGLVLRNLYGKYINPWTVTPDRVVRVNDLLIGRDTVVSSDPRSVYIQSVQYDANSQKVQWFGADDTTARAAFYLKRSYKPLARGLAAPLRTIAT